MIKIKRAYEPASEADGYRVLIDRLWPRGLRKDTFVLDAWHKELAPSTDLRRWFGHDPDKWTEFGRRYRRELSQLTAQAVLAELARRSTHGTVTLVYGARDELHNDAVVLRSVLTRKRLGRKVA